MGFFLPRFFHVSNPYANLRRRPTVDHVRTLHKDLIHFSRSLWW